MLSQESPGYTRYVECISAVFYWHKSINPICHFSYGDFSACVFSVCELKSFCVFAFCHRASYHLLLAFGLQYFKFYAKRKIVDLACFY